MNLDHRIRGELDHSATRMPISPDPSRAIHRARQRARKRAGGLALVGAVAITGGIAGAVLLTAADGDRSSLVDVAGNGQVSGEALDNGGGAESAPVTPDGPLELDWTLADIESPVNVSGNQEATTPIAATDGTLYAISTAPGVRSADLDDGQPAPQVLYHSVDGINWTVIPQDANRQLSSLGERGGVLYAVSTSAGADGVETSLVASSDDGASWTGLGQLPDLPPPPADPNQILREPHLSVSLAAADQVTVATRRLSYSVDAERVAEQLGLGPGQRVIPMNGANIDEYVVVDEEEMNACYDSQECMSQLDEDSSLAGEVARGALSEFGVEGLGAAGLVQHFVSSDDGRTWQAIDPPGQYVSVVGGELLAEALDMQQDVPIHFASTISVHRSADGVDWTEVPLPDHFESIAGTMGDRIIATGSESWEEHTGVEVQAHESEAEEGPGEGGWDRSILYVGTADGQWQEIDVESLNDAIPASFNIIEVSVSDLGAIVSIASEEIDTPMVLTTGDGLTWTALDTAEFGVGADAYIADVLAGVDKFTVTLGYTGDQVDGVPEPADSWTLVGVPTR